MKSRTTPKKTAVRTVRPRRNAKSEPNIEAPAAAIVRRTYNRRKKIEAPPILLEGDQPAPPPASGPGQKYALGPTPPPQQFETAETELPEAYGTKKLFLTARDPHWLYAHWDLTREQQLRAQREVGGRPSDSPHLRRQNRRPPALRNPRPP